MSMPVSVLNAKKKKKPKQVTGWQLKCQENWKRQKKKKNQAGFQQVYENKNKSITEG